MADFDIQEKIAGQPKWVWIVGGVGVLYAVNVLRNKNKENTVAPDNTNQEVNPDIYGYQTGSSGGSGLASLDPTSVPGVIGITAPTAGKPTPRTAPTFTAAQVRIAQANKARGFSAADVRAAQAAQANKARGFSAADVRAAQARQTAGK